MAKEYPTITAEEMIVDNTCMQLTGESREHAASDLRPIHFPIFVGDSETEVMTTLTPIRPSVL